jgi:tRNA pseudouridine55 synthase
MSPSGMLLLDKPAGITSFQSLGVVKRALDTRHIGHTGTLDKFASGLLIVLAGQMTRINTLFGGLKKEYEAVMCLGRETDTLDPEGKVVAEAEISSREALEAVFPTFQGEILQAPPLYSALHIDGKRASEIARAGREVEMKKRPVTIYELSLTSYDAASASAGLHVVCSAGTYIRSLARDIALAAGSRAYLTSLRRTRIGPFTADEAVHTGQADGIPPVTDAAGSAADLVAALRPVDEAIFTALGVPTLEADEQMRGALSRGRPLSGIFGSALADIDRSAASVVVFHNGTFAALIRREGQRWVYGFVAAGA